MTEAQQKRFLQYVVDNLVASVIVQVRAKPLGVTPARPLGVRVPIEWITDLARNAAAGMLEAYHEAVEE